MIWSFSVSDNRVFLTFDDGPNPEITLYYLKRLKELNWKATFFCVGENAIRYPSIVQQILDEGHAIGNHTFNHMNGWKTKTDVYLNSIEKTSVIIPSNLFRPPYGKITASQLNIISGKYHIIMWSFMTYDFDGTISLEQQVKKMQGIKAGDIIVQHDNEKFIENEKKVFEQLVQTLQSKKMYSDKIELANFS